MTFLAMTFISCNRFNHPLPVAPHQRTVTNRPGALRLSGQQLDDDFALLAQRSDMGRQTRILADVRRQDGTNALAGWYQPGDSMPAP